MQGQLKEQYKNFMRMEQRKANQPEEEVKTKSSKSPNHGLLTPQDNLENERLRNSARSANSHKEGQGERGYPQEANEENDVPLMDDNEIDDFCETSSWETSSEQEEV